MCFEFAIHTNTHIVTGQYKLFIRSHIYYVHTYIFFIVGSIIIIEQDVLGLNIKDLLEQKFIFNIIIF